METYLDVDKLVANPFIFEDKIIITKSRFSSMLSKSEALFVGGKKTLIGYSKAFIGTDVPTTRFNEEKDILLVARVIGNKRYEMPSGEKTLITHVEFVNAYEKEYKINDLNWALKQL